MIGFDVQKYTESKTQIPHSRKFCVMSLKKRIKFQQLPNMSIIATTNKEKTYLSLPFALCLILLDCLIFTIATNTILDHYDDPVLDRVGHVIVLWLYIFMVTIFYRGVLYFIAIQTFKVVLLFMPNVFYIKLHYVLLGVVIGASFFAGLLMSVLRFSHNQPYVYWHFEILLNVMYGFIGGLYGFLYYKYCTLDKQA